MQKKRVTVSRSMYSTAILHLYAGGVCEVKKHGHKLKVSKSTHYCKTTDTSYMQRGL
jgi:hypothetical protein